MLAAALAASLLPGSVAGGEGERSFTERPGLRIEYHRKKTSEITYKMCNDSYLLLREE